MTSIRVDEVPGGLWPGAHLLAAPDGKQALYIPDGEIGDALMHGNEAYRVVDPDWHLDLSDPLGLGLAGLAGRVAERTNYTAGEGPVHVAVNCLGLPWFPVDGSALPWQEMLVIAAQYLALTDRLCAALGFELEDGEVARWDSVAPGAMRCWRLNTAGGSGWMGGPSKHDDWLDALRAALAKFEPPGTP